VEGTVIDVRILPAAERIKMKEPGLIEKEEIAKLKRNMEDEIAILERENGAGLKT